MVDVVMCVLATNATNLNKKILHDNDIYDVVLELPLH